MILIMTQIKDYTLLYKLRGMLILTLLIVGKLSAQSTMFTDTFYYSGSSQTVVLPNCVNTITVEVMGAMGGWGSGSNAWAPGYGGYVSGILNINSGTSLFLNIGGAGTGSVGGFNGGGMGGQGLLEYGGGGGGATDIRIGGNTLMDRKIVAGGGGGGGSYISAFGGSGANFTQNFCGANAVGGEGGWYGFLSSPATSGGCSGGNGSSSFGGGAGGGLNSAGSLSGTGNISGFGQAGALGLGGNGGDVMASYGGAMGGIHGAGAGGAGYYGGAGGMTTNSIATIPDCGGGGGGSSYADTSLFSSITYSGTGTGDGFIVLKYYSSLPVISVSASSFSICNGSSVTLNASGVSTYTWLPQGSFPGSNNSSVILSPNISSNYTVLGSNSFGCVSQTVITIQVTTLTAIQINASPSASLCIGQSVILTANSSNNWLWTNSINTNTFNTPSLFVSPNVSTTYSVLSIDQNSCSRLGSIQVEVVNCTGIFNREEENFDLLIFPNPNQGDFSIKANSEMKLLLYNQFGEILFTSELGCLGHNTITFTDFKAGIYFVSVEVEGSRILKKLVVSN